MNKVQGYIQKEKRKKILLLSDDLRMSSGIATMSREIVLGTAGHFNWVQLGSAINHPDANKRFDLSQDTNNNLNITDASVFLYPSNGYGSPESVRQMIELEKPDAIMLFTDPRYWIWLFQMENEIRKKIPIFYLSIWDDYPAPLYNKPYYESCDLLMSISKQTKNIHELVLGNKAKDKVITYVPHGINEKQFYPITEFMKEESAGLVEMKKKLFGSDQPEFVVFYNARNIRRKCTSDLIAAYAVFCDKIGKEKAKKCALLLHTQPVDENGTDLNAVIELLCDPTYQRVVFSEERLSPAGMNLLYNIADVTALISSNEGWGLSLTESMMAGRMIIANVTGGMQDQMRFEDENGDWINFSADFPSNHFGRYKKHGEWAVPVFPTNMSIVGSIPTPYIFDDRCDFRDVAKAIEQVYNLDVDTRVKNGLAGRVWVTSEESGMSSTSMAQNVIESMDRTFETFKPKPDFELLKIEKLERKSIKHKLIYE
jgi:hypothetical protein